MMEGLTCVNIHFQIESQDFGRKIRIIHTLNLKRDVSLIINVVVTFQVKEFAFVRARSRSFLCEEKEYEIVN